MFGFVKKIFVSAMMFFGCNLSSVNSLECVSTIPMKNCVPDVVKNLKVKVFNLMSRANEARHIEWHVTCKCECRLDASVCNNKQCWNEDKCRCECKELVDIYVIKDLFGM